MAVLWNAHLGAYVGVMKLLEPRPDIAILGIAGRGNLHGLPFDGSAAQFALNEVQWLGYPRAVIGAFMMKGEFSSSRVSDTETNFSICMFIALSNHFELIQRQRPKL